MNELLNAIRQRFQASSLYPTISGPYLGFGPTNGPYPFLISSAFSAPNKNTFSGTPTQKSIITLKICGPDSDTLADQQQTLQRTVFPQGVDLSPYFSTGKFLGWIFERGFISELPRPSNDGEVLYQTVSDFSVFYT